MRTLSTLTIYALAAGLSVTAMASDWAPNLWLGRGGYWKARVPVTVEFPPDTLPAGEPIALTVPLIEGKRVEELRLTDDAGKQLLFCVTAGNAQVVTGAIPPNAQFYVPNLCVSNTATVRYWLYFDNPSAWGLADFLKVHVRASLNGGFESGNGSPDGWENNNSRPPYALSLSGESPFEGKRCVKAEAPDGAVPDWFGWVRDDFRVRPNSEILISVRVKGRNVKGTAGWYVHIGNENDSQIVNRVFKTGDGTFDWREQVIRLRVPENCTRLRTGSVLYGSGTAWYDAFTFAQTPELPEPSSVRIGAVERRELREVGADAPWLGRPSWLARLFGAGPRWAYRVPVRVYNFSDSEMHNVLSSVAVSEATHALRDPELLLTLNGEPVAFCLLGDRLLFQCSAAPKAVQTYFLYAKPGNRPHAQKTRPTESLQGSDIPSDQVLAADSAETDDAAYEKLLASPVNLVKNADFEEPAPEGWSYNRENSDGVRFSLATPGRFGKQCAEFTVPPAARNSWYGWHQTVLVKPGHSYIFGTWISGTNVSDSTALNVHLKDAKGQTIEFVGAGEGKGGAFGWTAMFSDVRIPQSITALELHLTTQGSGTLRHDGVLVAECLPMYCGDPEAFPQKASGGLAVWQVDSIVKVFRETAPDEPADKEFSISLARNEEETLQLAFRSGMDISRLELKLDAPKDGQGHTLSATLGWVGYVPIDHRTAYYNCKTPAWELKFPDNSGSSDGWAGWWPDPIRPESSGRLAANTTQAIWLLCKTDAVTPAGLYTGKLHCLADGREIRSIPFQVTVWNFAIDPRPKFPAIYDLHVYGQWLTPGRTVDECRRDMLALMAEKKLCPDRVEADPSFKRDRDGNVTADFTAYDKVASLYFDEFKFPHSYTPGTFYCFGWSHPPHDMLGEKPYEGDWPFANADRSQLRPQYKAAYQACLRLYWEHVKAKGWADKIVLYISDEPFFTLPAIQAQMKALCDMVHEVDPSIRIYCSTWRHCPQWDNSLDVWGAGHYGCFPVNEMRRLKAAGKHIWFTTDGQMCTDTPYCAVERLLPHYAFAYGAEAYEFWGCTWLTYNPWRFGWHSYIWQSDTPGQYYWVRYPNGDGFLIYPGASEGFSSPCSSIRLEAARDGVEDYEYLRLLEGLAAKNESARALLSEFRALVEIPNAGGRFSTRILPDPARLTALRLRAGALLSGAE
jgi:hypothetical protein